MDPSVKSSPIRVLHRRQFLARLGAWAALFSSLPLARSLAQAKAPDNGWQKAMKALTGGTEPALGKISLQFPPSPQNGALIPFTVTVDSPMTEVDYVKSIHLFATAERTAPIADFYLTPLSAKAEISSRIRLSQSQTIVALAQMSDGTFFKAERAVDVTIPGCFC